MADIILRAEKLGKRYQIGPTLSLGRSIKNSLRRWLGRPGARASAKEPSEFWALKDVEFNIEEGQIVGVIGRNGAGKSTLLKILSRITEPTLGRVLLWGRVSSLLEVGTGFHPDLTGRENIYLNGSILGMGRPEINRKFDEIVAFAEVEQFLETPIKRYSSGMYMRLAFAVAAHLDPDILIIDEVLAVGDAGFQRKCLGKINQVAGNGRTVLFVSHNLNTVLTLCSRCLYLEKGRLLREGPTAEVAAFYQSQLNKATRGTASDLRHTARVGNGKARFKSVRIFAHGPTGEEVSYLPSGHDLWVEATIEAGETVSDCNVALIIYAMTGERVVDANLGIHGRQLTLAACETARVRFHLREVLLKPGAYDLGVWLGRANIEDIDGVANASTFTVEPDPTSTLGCQHYPGFYQCRFTEEIDIQPTTEARCVPQQAHVGEVPIGTRSEKEMKVVDCARATPGIHAA